MNLRRRESVYQLRSTGFTAGTVLTPPCRSPFCAGAPTRTYESHHLCAGIGGRPSRGCTALLPSLPAVVVLSDAAGASPDEEEVEVEPNDCCRCCSCWSRCSAHLASTGGGAPALVLVGVAVFVAFAFTGTGVGTFVDVAADVADEELRTAGASPLGLVGTTAGGDGWRRGSLTVDAFGSDRAVPISGASRVLLLL